MPCDRPRSISDIFFYEELLRQIGPNESNEWLKSSFKKRPSTPSPKRTSVTASRVFKNSVSQDLSACVREGHSAEREKPPPVSRCSQALLPPNNSPYPSALDIELMAEAPDNVGLLFTDAAHTLLNDSKFALSLRRHKSTLF